MFVDFSITNQVITRTNSNRVVADSKNYLKARFTFVTDEWEGKTKTALFRHEKDSKVYEMLLENDECLVPSEVIKTGYMEVSVFCGDRVTANVSRILVERSGYDENAISPEPTPDIYAQIIEKLDELEGMVDQDAIRALIEEYFVEHPQMTEDEVNALIEKYLEEHPVPGGDSLINMITLDGNELPILIKWWTFHYLSISKSIRMSL